MSTAYRLRALLVIVIASLLPLAAAAQESVFEIEPAQSHVTFTLSDVLHTVHGTFQLKSGIIRFDRSTGAATGQLIVDATSGNSGSNGRDHKMHKDVLESAKYPDIVLAVQHVAGTLPTTGGTTLQIDGTMTLHGQSHPMSLTVPVQVNGTEAAADVNFDVPYVKWGLKNPSTLFLRVSQDVQISVHAVGKLQSMNSAAIPRSQKN